MRFHGIKRLYSGTIPQAVRHRHQGTSLWDRDVVEAFIGPDPAHPRRYAEFEVAPRRRELDLMVTNLPEKDFA